MLNFFTQHRHIALFFLFVFISMTLLSFHRSPQMTVEPTGILERGMLLILQPFQSMVTTAITRSQHVWNRYLALVHLSEENQLLREEIQHLRAENNRYIEDALAYGRLKGTLNLIEKRQFSTTLARVIGLDASNQANTILVNRGSDDGIEESLPVITLDGIVGVTVGVSKRSSKVLLLADPNCNVAALIQRTRDQGIVGGLGRKERYAMKYVNRRAVIREGTVFRLTERSLAQLVHENIPGFALTEQAFGQLRENNIPEDILVILEELHNQLFPTREAFLRALETTLGAEQAEWYSGVLLQYSQADILVKLRQLTNQEFLNRDDFLKALENALGTEAAQKYQERILRHVQEEETIVSSGLGGIFPKGLRIGIVAKVVKQDYGLFQEIEVTPSVDFSKLEEVLILQRDNPESVQ